MNQFLASAILAAVVLALVYVFMRVMRLEKDVKELRNRAPPMDLAQAVWGMASEPPQEMAFGPSQPKPVVEMFAEHPPALNQALLEEELEEDDEELIETFAEPLSAQPPPAEPPKESSDQTDQPDQPDQPIKDAATAPPARRPPIRKKRPPVPEQ